MEPQDILPEKPFTSKSPTDIIVDSFSDDCELLCNKENDKNDLDNNIPTKPYHISINSEIPGKNNDIFDNYDALYDFSDSDIGANICGVPNKRNHDKVDPTLHQSNNYLKQNKSIDTEEFTENDAPSRVFESSKTFTKSNTFEDSTLKNSPYLKKPGRKRKKNRKLSKYKLRPDKTRKIVLSNGFLSDNKDNKEQSRKRRFSSAVSYLKRSYSKISQEGKNQTSEKQTKSDQDSVASSVCSLSSDTTCNSTNYNLVKDHEIVDITGNDTEIETKYRKPKEISNNLNYPNKRFINKNKSSSKISQNSNSIENNETEFFNDQHLSKIGNCNVSTRNQKKLSNNKVNNSSKTIQRKNILNALLEDNVEEIERLLDEININEISIEYDYLTKQVSDRLPTTILHLCCKIPARKCFNLLIKQSNININAVVGDGSLITHAAAQGGEIDIFRQAVEMNISPHHKDNSGWTPLIYACEYGNLDIVKILIEKWDVDINQVCNRGYSPLMFCTNLHSVHNLKPPKVYIEESRKIAKTLLETEADVNISDKSGGTALMWSIQQRRFELIKILLFHRADIFHKKDDKQDSLDFAIFCRDLAVSESRITTKGFTKARSKKNHNKVSIKVDYANECLRWIATELLWQGVEKQEIVIVRRALLEMEKDWIKKATK